MTFKKDGEYYYGRKGRRWGVWQYHAIRGGGYGIFVCDYETVEEARAEVFNRNGWELKQYKKKSDESKNS